MGIIIPTVQCISSIVGNTSKKKELDSFCGVLNNLGPASRRGFLATKMLSSQRNYPWRGRIGAKASMTTLGSP